MFRVTFQLTANESVKEDVEGHFICSYSIESFFSAE